MIRHKWNENNICVECGLKRSKHKIEDEYGNMIFKVFYYKNAEKILNTGCKEIEVLKEKQLQLSLF